MNNQSLNYNVLKCQLKQLSDFSTHPKFGPTQLGAVTSVTSLASAYHNFSQSKCSSSSVGHDPATSGPSDFAGATVRGQQQFGHSSGYSVESAGNVRPDGAEPSRSGGRITPRQRQYPTIHPPWMLTLAFRQSLQHYLREYGTWPSLDVTNPHGG